MRPGETLLAHTSPSRPGWVCGGAVTLAQALLDAIGEDGTPVVPTHSGDNSDPSGWGDPPVPESRWPAIRATTPPYDPHTAPSRGVGAVPETVVRTWPGALRSARPLTSFATLGRAPAPSPRAHARVPSRRTHSARPPVGGRSTSPAPGTGYGSRTALHLAGSRIAGPSVRNPFAVRAPSGPRWTTVTDTSVSDEGVAEPGAGSVRTYPVQHGTAGGAGARPFPPCPPPSATPGGGCP
ncbi:MULTISPECIES: aminoglycoside N(3)-acetyltransferase [Streptomyces diastaticus group]|uniref:AAC(3) family N-acetyltransferase n=1 Tax=Streptomyces gougerotii TaxID=53448 RepID=A0A8H9LLG5_9ACTN|nr:AAC(3) family N-acetyltransferase [Streptomyces gougerotii]GFH66331.1 AAC(3) family N-acetyltransferase [Streptomyces rutgersensis]GFH75984.1 AAC(3) family N-acetyltransferase [Streptomyces gougerotii]GGU60922.1 AAC(3) family N-acetyltransferase [Streptomyces gougerotii]